LGAQNVVFRWFFWTNHGENVVLKGPSHDAGKHAISLRFIFGRAVDRDILDNIFDDRRADLSSRELQPDAIDASDKRADGPDGMKVEPSRGLTGLMMGVTD
jgi:hypothetical protein